MTLKYRPEIDGLRAMAVLPVILFHAGFSTFSGGFVGVDVFFVISGFLITSIIVTDVEAGKFSFLDFYERRARRILPALFLVMLCCIPFAWLWMFPKEMRDFAISVRAVCLFISNFWFWERTDYFEPSSELKPLLHTWSLAVEEQFYIIFPVAILLLWRLTRRKAIWAIALVALVSLAWSHYASRHYPNANFYFLPSRAWELLAGALCSFAVVKDRGLWNQVLSLAGFCAVTISVFAFDDMTPFPSLYALLPVLGTCAIILFARQGTIVGSILSSPPLVGIGLISYSAYLWHQPLFAFARLRSLAAPSWELMLGLAFCSLALAYVSWRFVELPARNRHSWPLPSRRSAFAVLGSIAAGFIAFGTAGHLMKGFPSRIPASAVSTAGLSEDENPRRKCIGSPSRSVPPAQSCVYGDEHAVRVALHGDSHAHALAFELGKQLSESRFGLKEFTYTSCPPISSYRTIMKDGEYDCGDYHMAVTKYLAADPQIDIVMLWARWPLYAESNRFNNGEGGIEDGSIVFPITDDFGTSDEGKIREKIGELYQRSITELLDAGKKVVLIYPQPEIGWNVPGYISKAMLLGANIQRPLSVSHAGFRDRARFAQDKLDALSSPNLLRIYPEKIFCDTFVSQRCAAEDGTSLFYYDDDHVSSAGAALISKEILNALRAKGWIEQRP